MKMHRLGLALGLLALPAVGLSAQDDCSTCHRELEFLRQHTRTLQEAREFWIPSAPEVGSGHVDMECAECHTGFTRFPHAETGTTESCASCHEEESADKSQGMHGEDAEVDCAACHTVHDVRAVAELEEPEAIAELNASCAACHREQDFAPADVHAEEVLCSGCHRPHDTRSPSSPLSALWPAQQSATCGSCHDTVSVAWRDDVHGTAAHEGVTDEAYDGESPSCTGCHGSHAVLAPSQERFDRDIVGRCGSCHEAHEETYFGTYHGKVTVLGSEIAATCDDCHGSHDVYPASDARSMVSEERLVETCAECHEQARPAFVAYDSHPNPLDRDRNAILFYSFVFMNVLLVGALGTFGLHTFLWWVRLVIEMRREARHAEGGHHG